MIDLLLVILHGHVFLLSLDLSHQLFGIFICAGHDVGDAEIGQYDWTDIEDLDNSSIVRNLCGFFFLPSQGQGEQAYLFIVLFDDRFIKADGVLVLLLHEQHVADVQAPSVVVIAELDRFSKDLLDRDVVLHVPVDAGLSHENRYVSFVRAQLK